MDPVSATSVAAFAIQVVDFNAKKLGNSLGGETFENSDNRTAVLILGKECQDVASELLAALQKLKGVVNQHKWKSFRLALLAIWRSEHIEALERRLDRFRQQFILPPREQLQAQYKRTQNDTATIDREIGRYFLQHLKDTEQIHKNLINEIETKLFEAIRSRPHESSVILDPPKDRIKTLSNRLLRKLDFTEITQRHERISTALRDTFQWVYQESMPDQNWASFMQWLANDDGIYWITGKPGSGKSTLMKFIQGDDRTMYHLKRWSKGIPLISAGFYFWNSGTEMQMSNEGLLRSLLYQISSGYPELIPDIFPERWETLNLFGSDSRPWTSAECLRSFRLLSGPKFSHLRFFLLIDGLDEFLGDHTELVDLVKEMAFCEHIKICVASRPWVVFQEAFDRRPSLMLQDLTTPDIELYVRTKFDNNDRFSHIKRRDPEFAEKLCQQVATRSSGVFLWVRLVVQSLLQGISNGDRVSDLYQRLNDLPGDLDELFHKILDSLDPRYKQHASELFQIHRACSSIPALRFSFADDEDDSIWKDGKTVALTIDDLNFRRIGIKRRIDSRTKGLLEMDKWKTNTLEASSHPVPPKIRNQCQIQYLHRTVKDFVEQKETWNALTQITPSFDPYVSICKAFILEVKTFDFTTHTADDLRGFVYKAMLYASAARPTSHQILDLLLVSLNTFVSTLLKTQGTTFDPLDPRVPKGHLVLFPMAIQMDLDFWIRNLLDRGHPLESRKHLKPYISFAIEKKIPNKSASIYGDGWEINHCAVSKRCLRLLLDRGASVYEKQNDLPFWKYVRLEFVEVCTVLVSSSSTSDSSRADNFHHWLDAIEIMAEFGADIPSLRNLIPDRRLKEIKNMYPNEMNRLREVLKMWDESSTTHSNSPRIRAMERVKRRRLNP